MSNRRVRAGVTYLYEPVMLDILNPPAGAPEAGDLLTVVNLPGCPRANTMGHCHVNFAHNGKFAGLVCTNSLQRK